MNKPNVLIIIDPWERNIWQKIFFFSNSTYFLFKAIKKFVKENLDTIDTIVIASYDNRPVDKMIENIPGKKIYATKVEEIKEIIHEKNENIYLSGSAWDICVAHRELGYLNLKKVFKHINLLVKDDCVRYSSLYDNKIFDPVDNPDWVETNTIGTFKYVGK